MWKEVLVAYDSQKEVFTNPNDANSDNMDGQRRRREL